MLRKVTALGLTLILLMSLCACGRETAPRNDSAPGRMVRRIEVAIHPADPAFDRTYVTQENMNALLSLLRSMVTEVYPTEEPDPEGGQSMYTITVTFANGQQGVYRMLGHRYLQLGDDPWCVLSTEQTMLFSDFIHSHPSDDGSVPTETTTTPTEMMAPTETTAPAE